LIAQLTPGASESQRFRALDRLRESRDYARSRSQGKRVTSRYFALEATPSLRSTRLGLVVSRRVGGAVTRNRVKRVVREWFRRGRAELPGALDLVIVARSAANGLTTREAWLDLSALAARISR
jgi:ribonuclease P protein component